MSLTSGVRVVVGQGTEADQITGFHELRGRQVVIAMAGILLGLLLSALDSSIVGTAMPRIIAELGGLDHYAWVATSYLLTSTAAVPIFGKLSDIYGRKWFYAGGLILFMFASALCGLSQAMFQLIAFRGLQGVAGGILTANAFAIIGDLFPPAERGKWQGVSGSVFGLASVGRACSGWLADGWPGLAVGVLRQPAGRHPRRHRGDVRLAGYPAARTPAHRLARGGDDRRGDGAVAARLLLGRHRVRLDVGPGPRVAALAFVMTGAFIFVESRVPEPILSLDLFRGRTFTISVIAMFLVGGGMFGAIMYVPLFMQGVLAASATASGAALTPMMLSLVAASTIGGQVISRTGRYKWASVSGLGLMAVGMG